MIRRRPEGDDRGAEVEDLRVEFYVGRGSPNPLFS